MSPPNADANSKRRNNTNKAQEGGSITGEIKSVWSHGGLVKLVG